MVNQLKPSNSLNNKKKTNTDMKKYILSIILGTALLFTANKLSAQPGFDDDVEDTPIDGGITLVMAAGLAYGVSKMKKTK